MDTHSTGETLAIAGAHRQERNPAAATEHDRLATEVIRLRAREFHLSAVGVT